MSATSPATEAERARANAMPRDQIEFWSALYNGNISLLSENNVATAKRAGKPLFYVTVAGPVQRINMQPEQLASFCKQFIDSAAMALLKSPEREGKLFYKFITEFASVANDAETKQKQLAALESEINKLKAQKTSTESILSAEQEKAAIEGSIREIATKANLYRILDDIIQDYGEKLGLTDVRGDVIVAYIGKMLVRIAEEQQKNFSSLLGDLPDTDD
jgi:DNA repair exonuclease SbcCD ATPase subunit